MTIKTTIPAVFTGALSAALPRFLHTMPAGTVARRHVASSTNQPAGAIVDSIPDATGTYGAMIGSQKPVMTLENSMMFARFDGVDDYLGATDGATIAPRTAFVVARFRSVPAAGYFNWIFDAGLQLSLANNGQLATFNGGAVIYTDLKPGTDWHVFHVTATAGQVIVGMDYLERTVADATVTGISLKASAGGRNNASQPAAAEGFAEYVGFTGTLTAAERASVVRSLRANYGI